MAPDLLPVTAVCTGLVLRRSRLIRAGLVSLLVGLGVACLLAAAVTGFLNLFGLLPAEFAVHEIGLASQQHIEAETIIVALAAGLAGMLAVETRASMGVGVAISVTTIPLRLSSVSPRASASSRNHWAPWPCSARISR